MFPILFPRRVRNDPRKSGLPDLRIFDCRSRASPRSVSAAHHTAVKLAQTAYTCLRCAALRPGHEFPVPAQAGTHIPEAGVVWVPASAGTTGEVTQAGKRKFVPAFRFAPCGLPGNAHSQRMGGAYRIPPAFH